MKAFVTYLLIQFKMDLRDRGTLLTYYFTPLVFFIVTGSVFTSTSPLIKSTLAASMTIFSATMGAIVASPTPLVKMRESGTMRAYKVSGISPVFTLAVSAVSAFIHLFIVSVIVYIVSPICFHSDLPVASGLYFVVLSAFLFASVGVGMLIGVCAQGHSFASMISMLIFLPSMLLSGIMFPASMLPDVLIWAGRILPATYALQSFYGYAYQRETDINAGISLCINVGIGLIMFFFAGWRLNRASKSEEM
ncbi:MAG: ABC transporter permease [Paenibacillaceae bacterium]|nr:ABC transporter permease [Paenibacillaceae bacterium]